MNNEGTKAYGDGVSVCPGPNMAYFSKITSLQGMIDHIYGRANIITRNDRPNMFVKELKIYIDFLKNKIEETKASMTNKQEKNLLAFVQKLKEGINYYSGLFNELKDRFEDTKSIIQSDLEVCMRTLHILKLEIENLSLETAVVQPD